MSLHRLSQIVMVVPNVEQTAGCHTEFGLIPVLAEEVSVCRVISRTPTGDHTLGGEQLRIVYSDQRRLVQLGVDADYPDDLDRVAASLTGRHAGTGERAPGILRKVPVRPRKLGLVVLGSTNQLFFRSSSGRASGSRSATTRPASRRLCAAPRTSTTCWFSRHRRPSRTEDLGALMTGARQAAQVWTGAHLAAQVWTGAHQAAQ